MSVEITNILLGICVYKIDKSKITLKILYDINKNVYKYIKNTLQYRPQVCQKIRLSHKNTIQYRQQQKLKTVGEGG